MFSVAFTAAACSGSSAASLPSGKLLAAARRPTPIMLTGATPSGTTADISAWRGDVVVLNAWGSWCGPCKLEAPTLATLAREFAGRNVHFLGLDERDNPSDADAFEARYGIPYPSINDAAGRAVAGIQSLPVDAVPTTLILDRAGRPAGRIIGGASAQTLRPLITELLTEQEPRVHP